MTLQLRSLIFDERRDERTPICHLCGKRVTGHCKAAVPAQCRHARAPALVPSHAGARFAQPDTGDCE